MGCNQHTICYYNGYTANYCQEFGPIWNGAHEVIAIFENEKKSSFTVLTELNGEIWKTSLSNTIYKLNENYQKIGVDYRDVQRVIANPVLKKEDPGKLPVLLTSVCSMHRVTRFIAGTIRPLHSRQNRGQ